VAPISAGRFLAPAVAQETGASRPCGMLFRGVLQIGGVAMAYIPSDALEYIIENSKVGLWIDPMHDGAFALVCKMPEGVIKALYLGAECSFLLSVVQVESLSIMCLGLRIQDEPDNPFTVIGCSPSDHLASVKEILGLRATRLHCLNELNHPVLSAWCSLDAATAQGALDRLRSENLTPVIAGEPSDVFRISELALRRFQKHIYRSDKEGELPAEMTAAIPLAMEIWEPGEVFEVSPTARGGPFRIDDDDEGNKLERQVYLSIDAIYPGRTYHRPEVRATNKELIDVLGFDRGSICLVESKSLSVLTVDPHRSSQRRASNVRKDVLKAMKQLRGALTRIRSGSQICDVYGRPIMIADHQDLLAHAIVLLSEMYFFLDWELIAREVASASESERHKALFHVMDFIELSHIVNQCKDADDFNQWMIQRWAWVKTEGTAYGRIIQLPPTLGVK